MIYAHTKEGRSAEEWEFLYGNNGHAALTEQSLRAFRSPFVSEVADALKPLFFILARYHDMGKGSSAFQRYLQLSAAGKHPVTVDHKTAAARWFWDGDLNCPLNPYGIMLAYAFCGHHSGLPDGTEQFADRFRKAEGIHLAEAISALPPEWQQKPELPKSFPLLSAEDMTEFLFQLSFMTRMLHSSLVDADWLATEAFMQPEQAAKRADARDAFSSLAELSERLEGKLVAYEEEARRKGGAKARINALRREIHAACFAAAARQPGVFRLNVPTGGGKTLSSLSFALEHARRHGMQRVIYVIPYTSIIDQTADEFRKVLGEANVVEHHSNLGEGKDTEGNRLASENWDAPLIVTTAVQFFESLFSCSNRRCRKLHNIAHSVIVFDEAQTLPTSLLAPCLAAMKSLQKLCGCSLVLCTATQPALERREEFKIGFKPEDLHSLIGEELEKRLAREMKRVEVAELGRLELSALVEHVRVHTEGSALIIVNLTRQAQDVYAALAELGQEGLYHLSARMCPAHRRKVLEKVRDRLDAGKPTVLVATRVVEAGVDVSFPVVYRDACGLDSLAQAAGRCNRHGEAAMGQVYSFKAAEAEYQPPSSFVDQIDGIGAREDALLSGGEIFSHEVIARYFHLFYQKRGERSRHWDSEGVMAKVGSELEFMRCWDFPAMERAFGLIPGGQISVLVPYGAEGQKLRERLLFLQHAKLMPSREDFRLAQQYSVSVYAAEWERLQAMGDMVHEDAGLFMLSDERAYSEETGLLREFSELSYIC